MHTVSKKGYKLQLLFFFITFSEIACTPTHENWSLVVQSKAEKFRGWNEAQEQADNETDWQTLDDFGLALKPASHWLISFWPSADRDKSKRVCIDHLTMIICCDANGQVAANEKDLDKKVVLWYRFSIGAFFFVFLFLCITSDVCFPSYFLPSSMKTSTLFLATTDSPTLTNLICDWHRWATCSLPAIQRGEKKARRKQNETVRKTEKWRECWVISRVTEKKISSVEETCNNSVRFIYIFSNEKGKSFWPQLFLFVFNAF